MRADRPRLFLRWPQVGRCDRRQRPVPAGWLAGCSSALGRYCSGPLTWLVKRYPRDLANDSYLYSSNTRTILCKYFLCDSITWDRPRCTEAVSDMYIIFPSAATTNINPSSVYTYTHSKALTVVLLCKWKKINLLNLLNLFVCLLQKN